VYRKVKIYGDMDIRSLVYFKGFIMFVGDNDLYTVNKNGDVLPIINGVDVVGLVKNNVVALGNSGVFKIVVDNRIKVEEIGEGVDLPEGLLVLRECGRKVLVSSTTRDIHAIVDLESVTAKLLPCSAIYGTLNIENEHFLVQGSLKGLKLRDCSSIKDKMFIRLRGPLSKNIWSHRNHISIMGLGGEELTLMTFSHFKRSERVIEIPIHLLDSDERLFPLFGTLFSEEICKIILMANDRVLTLKYDLANDVISFHKECIAEKAVGLFPSGNCLVLLSKSEEYHEARILC